MSARQLAEHERDLAEWLFYGCGYTLAEVAAEVECSIYDLLPWLTRPITDKVLRKAEARVAAIDAAMAERYRDDSVEPSCEV